MEKFSLNISNAVQCNLYISKDADFIIDHPDINTIKRYVYNVCQEKIVCNMLPSL